MNIREMNVPLELSPSAVLAALDVLNGIDADSLKKGVDYVEIQHAPTLDEMERAEEVARKLLKHGIGVKLVVHWPFKGTRAWALQTDRTRIVNKGV